MGWQFRNARKDFDKDVCNNAIYINEEKKARLKCATVGEKKDQNYLKYYLSILGFANCAERGGDTDKERLKTRIFVGDFRIYL